jgi:predicted O-linked N-acetylglucosamine transferase (SPINDLY family)
MNYLKELIDQHLFHSANAEWSESISALAKVVSTTNTMRTLDGTIAQEDFEGQIADLARAILPEKRVADARFLAGQTIMHLVTSIEDDNDSIVICMLDCIASCPDYRHIVVCSTPGKSTTSAAKRNELQFSRYGVIVRRMVASLPLEQVRNLDELIESIRPTIALVFSQPDDLVSALGLAHSRVFARGNVFDANFVHGGISPRPYRGGVVNHLAKYRPPLRQTTVQAFETRNCALPFMTDGTLVTCSSSILCKDADDGYHSYSSFVCGIVEATGGSHVHIGPLPPELIDMIQQRLQLLYIRADAFQHIDAELSIWRDLLELKVDIYIPYFHENSNRPLIEAIGAGIPIALGPRTQFDADFGHSVWKWRTQQDLLKLLAQSTPATLREQSMSARDHFERRHSPNLLSSQIKTLLKKAKNRESNASEQFDPVHYLSSNRDVFEHENDSHVHLNEFGVHDCLNPNPLHDVAYVSSQDLPFDIANSDALLEFVTDKLQTSVDAHPLFDVQFYIKNNSNVLILDMNPLLHYYSIGAAQGASPHPLFDPVHYLRQVDPADAFALANPLAHFLLTPNEKLSNPNVLFDCAYYLARYSDVVGINPLLHYALYGFREGREPHPLFRSDYYSRQCGLGEPESMTKSPLEHFLSSVHHSLVSPHPLFRISYYIAHHPEWKASSPHPLLHYLEQPCSADCYVHPLFDSAFYREQLSGEIVAGSSLLELYLSNEYHKPTSPHWLFSPDFYRTNYGRDMDRYWQALTHFVETGAFHGLQPHPLFDPSYYILCSKRATHDLRMVELYVSEKLNASVEFDPHPLFSVAYYRRRNPDLARKQQHPLKHFLTEGYRHLADPHPLFCSAYYIESLPELANLQSNPVLHFLTAGKHNIADPHPLFSVEYFNQRYDSGPRNPLVHYLLQGIHAREMTHPTFDSNYYAQAYGDVAASSMSPLHHFVEVGMSDLRRTLPHDPNTAANLEFLSSSLLNVGNAVDARAAMVRAMGLNTISSPVLKVTVSRFSSIEAWCRTNELPFKTIEPAQVQWVQEPKIFKMHELKVPGGYIQLPMKFLAELTDCTVIGSTSMVLAKDGTILSDELTFMDRSRHHPRSRVIKAISPDLCMLAYYGVTGLRIPSGIHLCLDYTQNYFHWLIECLPRLAVLDAFPEYDDYPLIIEDGMPRQHEEALKFINKKQRKIVYLGRNQSINVGNLVYVSQESIVHDNMREVPVPADVKISPKAMRQLRQWFLATKGNESIKRRRTLSKHIYLSRRNATYRRLRNEQEVELLLLSKGFSIILPEEFSFADQIDIFSNAEVIIAPTGAGMTNLIFAPPKCQIYVLYNGNEFSNYYLWSQMAAAVNVDLSYIVGKELNHCFADERYVVHNDFFIDLQLLTDLVDNLVAGMRCAQDHTPPALPPHETFFCRATTVDNYLSSCWLMNTSVEDNANFENQLRTARLEATRYLFEMKSEQIDIGLHYRFFKTGGHLATMLTAVAPSTDLETFASDEIQRLFKEPHFGLRLERAILLANMYFSAYQLPLLRDVAGLSEIAFESYLCYLTRGPLLAGRGAHARYADYLVTLADWLIALMVADLSQLRRALIYKFVREIDFSPIYYADQSVRPVLAARKDLMSCLIENDPTLKFCQIHWSPPQRSSTSRRMRVGFLCRTLRRGPDSEALCAQFQHFDLTRYEFFAYSIGVNDTLSREDSEFTAKLNRFIGRRITISGRPADMVERIREDKLDIFILASITTFGISDIDFALANRLANIQVALNSIVPTSTGLESFDYFLTMDGGAETLSAFQEECTELVKPIPGVPICFEQDERPIGKPPFERVSLGIADDEVVFYSAGAAAKLSFELLITWCRIVKRVSGGRLLLAPFNPGWGGRQTAFNFKRKLRDALSESGLDVSRVTLLNEMSRMEAEFIPSLCDVYLSSFPFGGATSVALALSSGIPVVARHSRFIRCVDPVLCKSAGLASLVAADAQDYEEIAVRLGNSTTLRIQARETLKNRIHSLPFLDSETHSCALQAVFDCITAEHPRGRYLSKTNMAREIEFRGVRDVLAK